MSPKAAAGVRTPDLQRVNSTKLGPVSLHLSLDRKLIALLQQDDGAADQHGRCTLISWIASREFVHDLRIGLIVLFRVCDEGHFERRLLTLDEWRRERFVSAVLDVLPAIGRVPRA